MKAAVAYRRWRYRSAGNCSGRLELVVTREFKRLMKLCGDFSKVTKFSHTIKDNRDLRDGDIYDFVDVEIRR